MTSKTGSSQTGEGFDRLKPRVVAGKRPLGAPRADREGKGVLFSAGDATGGTGLLGPLGTVTVRCSACSVTTALTPWAALRAALPSVHIFVPRREFPSWMRCPACARRTWVRVGVRSA